VHSLNNDKARHVHVRGLVACPALTVAFVVSLALALAPFGPAQATAQAASTTPIDIATPSPTSTSAPSPTSTSAPSPTSTSAPSPASTSTAAGTATTAAPSLPLAPGAAFGDHHVLARIEGPQLQANYLPVDEPVPDAAQFQTFRVRFRLHNAGTAPITETPRLEFRPELGAGFVVVPEKPEVGVPVHLDREWVPSLGLGGGTIEGPLGADIPVADLRIGKEGGLALVGHRSMGANPDQPITLPPSSYTEEEFTVTLSMAAKYLTAYELRITNGGAPLTGTDVATIRLGAEPTVQLSPGQRHGVAVVDPKKTSSAGIAYPPLTAPSMARGAALVTAVPAVQSPSTLIYPLISSTLSAAATVSGGIHGPYTVTTNACDTCHRGHAAQAPNLLVPGSQSALCFSCHGTAAGAATNVQAEYATPPLVVNDSVSRDYYSHDADGPSKHTQSGLNEFQGVFNRHSSCADCHNSHKAATTPDSAQTLDGSLNDIGWSASGRLKGISGVSVANGAAGTAPIYSFLSGATDNAIEELPVPNQSPVTLEYQLCFKCHSGFTNLLPSVAGKPSKDALDKGVELNPANPSFHPVEAAGKNGTNAMKASLAGTSTYKLWDFNIGSTIRCLNCHASGATPGDPAIPPLPLPGVALPPHASSNRGILLRPYQDRVLKSPTDAYSSNNFALCYVCHSEAPFDPNGTSSTATNFSEHSRHLTLLTSKGDPGTDIDTAGSGGGNAICAECHFRIHSTTNAVGVVGNPRLVSFAPNVTANGATLSWTPGPTDGTGSCTLTCHTHTHLNAPYAPAP
jgi:predicted CXXCH cytochrome family protein